MSNDIHINKKKKEIAVIDQEDPKVKNCLKILNSRETLRIKFGKTEKIIEVRKNSINKLFKLSHNKNIKDMLDYITYFATEIHTEIVKTSQKMNSKNVYGKSLKYELKQSPEKSQMQGKPNTQNSNERKNSSGGKGMDQTTGENKSPIRRSKTLSKLLAAREENKIIGAAGLVTKPFKETEPNDAKKDATSVNTVDSNLSSTRRISAKSILLKPGTIIKRTHEKEVSDEEEVEEPESNRKEVKRVSLKLGQKENTSIKKKPVVKEDSEEEEYDEDVIVKMQSSKKKVIDIKKKMPQKKFVAIKKDKTDKMMRFQPKEQVSEKENEDDEDEEKLKPNNIEKEKNENKISETVPVEEPKIPVEENTINQEDKMIPVEENKTSQDEATIPIEENNSKPVEEIILQHEEIIPPVEENNILSSEENNSKPVEEIILQHEETIPPVEENNILSSEENNSKPVEEIILQHEEIIPPVEENNILSSEENNSKPVEEIILQNEEIIPPVEEEIANDELKNQEFIDNKQEESEKSEEIIDLNNAELGPVLFEQGEEEKKEEECKEDAQIIEEEKEEQKVENEEEEIAKNEEPLEIPEIKDFIEPDIVDIQNLELVELEENKDNNQHEIFEEEKKTEQIEQKLDEDAQQLIQEENSFRIDHEIEIKNENEFNTEITNSEDRDSESNKKTQILTYTQKTILETIEEVKDSIIIPVKKKEIKKKIVKKPKIDQVEEQPKEDKRKKYDKMYPNKKISISKNANKSSLILSPKSTILDKTNITEKEVTPKEIRENTNTNKNLDKPRTIVKLSEENKRSSTKLFNTKKWDDKDLDKQLKAFKNKIQPKEFQNKKQSIDDKSNSELKTLNSPQQEVKPPKLTRNKSSMQNNINGLKTEQESNKPKLTRTFSSIQNNFKTEKTIKKEKKGFLSGVYPDLFPERKERKGFISGFYSIPELDSKKKLKDSEEDPLGKPKPSEQIKGTLKPRHKKTDSLVPKNIKGKLLTLHIATCKKCKIFYTKLLNEGTNFKKVSLAQCMREYNPDNCFFCLRKLTIENRATNDEETAQSNNQSQNTSQIKLNRAKSTLGFKKTKNDWYSADASYNNQMFFGSTTKTYITNFGSEMGESIQKFQKDRIKF